MSSKKEKKHTLLKAAGAAAVAGTAAYAGFGYYVFRNVFDLENTKIYSDLTGIRKISASSGELSQWLAHSCRTDEFTDSFDGLKMHAVCIMNHPDSHKWVIMMHGLGSYSGSMLEYLHEADSREYNILAADLRGCGMSEGKYTGLGWAEHYDLVTWINYLIGKDPDSSIALYGIRTGAAAVMNACGDYLPGNVMCAVEDGGYTDVRSLISSGIKKYCKVDGKPFMPSVDLYVKQILRFSLKSVRTKQQLSHCTVPMMFVHGAEDQVVPTSNVFDAYYACASDKELYVVEGAGYAETSGASDYFKRTFDFIDQHM